MTQSLERSERVGVDRFPVHLHDRDVTVDVLSSGAAENVRTSTLSDENTISVDSNACVCDIQIERIVRYHRMFW
jgi:hypothetical protein